MRFSFKNLEPRKSTVVNVKVLKEISNEKYFVENCCTYFKSANSTKKICNFYVRELNFNRNFETVISFTVTLRFMDEDKKCDVKQTFPICFYDDPIGWLRYGFHPSDFRIYEQKAHFNLHMKEIFNLLCSENLYGCEESILGWDFDAVNLNKLIRYICYDFNKFEDPFDSVYQPLNEITECDIPEDTFFEYMKLADINVSVPLMSFMLLALLNSFELSGPGTRPGFIMAITGKTEEIRRKTALFFTNMFKRDSSFNKNEYKLFHIIQTDTLAEIRFKSEYAKDSVLIAFEPDNRQLNYLVNKLYKTNVIDEEHPIRSLCLITADNLNNVKADNIINIHLDENFSLDRVTEFFSSKNDRLFEEDKLTENIYYYIKILINKLNDDKHFVRNQFVGFKSLFEKSYNFSDFSALAYSTSILLSFAVDLYVWNSSGIDSPALDHQIKEILIQTAKRSFPQKGKVTVDDFSDAMKVCRILDDYFSKNKAEFSKIRQSKYSGPVLMWYDEGHFYIKGTSLTKILKDSRAKSKFSAKVKQCLAEKKAIESYKKDDGKYEYSINLHKQVYADLKTNGRFVAFNREECRKYNLFEKLEKHCQELEKKEADKIEDAKKG